MAATPPLDADSPQPDKVTPGTTDSWDVVDGEDNGLGHFLAQASDLPPDGDQADQDDAYQVISSNTARGPDKQFRVHLLTFWANPMGYGKCTRCFAKGDLPQSWFVSRHGSVEGKDIPDLEVDTGSDTDDSVDTQSEADAVPLPKVLPVESWGGIRGTHLGLPASFGNGGCARQTFGLGESYCLTHPCPPGEAEGILKLTKRYSLGEDPSINQSALEKACVQLFALLGSF